MNKTSEKIDEIRETMKNKHKEKVAVITVHKYQWTMEVLNQQWVQSYMRTTLALSKDPVLHNTNTRKTDPWCSHSSW